jgi:hypothetical protein
VKITVEFFMKFTVECCLKFTVEFALKFTGIPREIHNGISFGFTVELLTFTMEFHLGIPSEIHKWNSL